MRSSTEVLICGAGAAGLTLAIELARRGVEFRIIDKLATPFGGSRGKGIQPRTQEILEDLGVLDRAVSAGGPYPPIRSYLADGSCVDTPLTEQPQPACPGEPYRLPLMVPQFRLEALLRERLAELGALPEFGAELMRFAQTGKGVEAWIRSGEGEVALHARYLVGADGGRSFVRKTLGIDFPGKALGIRALVADVHLEGLTRDHWHQFGGKSEEALAICPLSGTALFQLQGPIPVEGEIDLSAAGLEILTRRRTGNDAISIRSVTWASAYSMSARLAERYRDGQVFLVGDAAHVHPPTGGQGLNTSVQDACNLGWKLAAVIGGAPAALLDTYEEERRPIARDMLGLSTRLLDAYKRGDSRRGRDVQQLDLGYAGSSLARTISVRTSGPRSGDRAPDIRFVGAGGQPRRLFDLSAGTHWTLLGCHADRSDFAPRSNLRIHATGPRGDLLDPEGNFRSTYGVGPGDWVLIRPDGYIGAIADAGQARMLEEHMHGIGLAGVPVA